MGYVFISYSTKNQQQADSMKDLLNRNGISTWMAPYDIPVGSNFGEEVPKAIKESDCVILMLSNASQSSHWVSRELVQAVSDGHTIIPVKIEDMILNDKFSFYFGEAQITAVQQIDENQEEIINLLTRLSNIIGLTSEEKKINVSKFQKNHTDKVEERFYVLIQELYDIFFEYKEAFRLANQEDVNRTSYALQKICFQLFSFYEKYLNTEHHKIAEKAGQITSQYNVYVEKYNAFVEELSLGYGDKSNERALEAENALNELTKIIKSFLD